MEIRSRNCRRKTKSLYGPRSAGIILKAHWAVDDNVDTEIPDMDRDLLVCIDASKEGLGRSIDARRSSDRLHLKEIKKA
jgi:hypothetical protein